MIPHTIATITVASLAEAWIEMTKKSLMIVSDQSLPLRKRGLKFASNNQISTKGAVASLAEAWIEICLALETEGLHKSLPLRKRGLK